MWNFKRIFLLSTAILALGFYLYHSDRLSRERAESRVQSKKILQLPDKNQIESLLIENTGKEPLEISKEGNRWWIVKPFRYEAEDLVVDGLLSALTLTTWERSFPAGGVDPEEMGLANPDQKITVTLRAESGLEKKRLLMGRDAPTGKYIYARWEESSEIFMLYEQFSKAFDKSLYALRKKRIFDAAAEEIFAVRVSLEGRNFALVKRDGTWQAARQPRSEQAADGRSSESWQAARQPRSEQAADGRLNESWQAEVKEAASIDPVKAERFLSDLTGFYAKEFLDGMDPQNPDLALTERKYSIRLVRNDNTEIVLWIGKANKEKEAFYGLKEGEQTVILIPETKIWEMPRSLRSFEKKEGPAVQPEFERVKIEMAKKAVETVKIDGKWRLEPAAKEGEEEVLNQTVSELIGYLRDADFGDPDPAIKELPSKPEVLYVKLVTPDKKSWEYTFYKKDNTIVGQLSSQAGYLRLDESVWNELSRYYQQIYAVKKS